MQKIDGSTALMAHLIPDFVLKDQKVELIFILDRSGSMMGQSIELAKQALAVSITSYRVSYLAELGIQKAGCMAAS
jgi:hypothetical protein